MKKQLVGKHKKYYIFEALKAFKFRIDMNGNK
jgi:hypothetical protein